MKQLWMIVVAAALGLASAPSWAQPNTMGPLSARSLCKANELEFMSAWMVPEGPGGWAAQAGPTTLSVCASNFAEEHLETIHIRAGSRQRLTLNSALTPGEWGVELDQDSFAGGYDLTVKFDGASGDKYTIRQVHRADSGIFLAKNGEEIHEFALLDSNGKAYAGRGLIGLLSWISARREQYTLK